MADEDYGYEEPVSSGGRGGIMGWIKQHKELAFAIGSVLLLLVGVSLYRGRQQQQVGTAGPQAADNGITTLPNGYSVVPTSPTDASTNAPSYTAPDNTAATLDALANFNQSQNPPTPTSAPAPTPTPTPAPSSGNGLGGLLGGLDLSHLPDGGTSSGSGTPSTSKTPKPSHATKGTPNQAPGTPIVQKHPANPNPLPPTRSTPVTHPSQGKSSPTTGPTTAHPARATTPAPKPATKKKAGG